MEEASHVKTYIKNLKKHKKDQAIPCLYNTVESILMKKRP